jgi:choline dehydrogenase-like flavoprotein
VSVSATDRVDPTFGGRLIQHEDVSDKKAIEDLVDVVIIGSGAAGATAARVLTEAGLEVAIIEEGPYVPTEQLRSDMYSALKQVWRDMGFQVARGRAFSPILQGRCVGGTTAINGAIIHRMPESIHEHWCEEYGVRPWLSYGDLSRVWDQLDSELHVGQAPEPVRGLNNLLMEKGATATGARGNWVRRNVKDCQGSAHCAQGCPTASRQSMNVSYVPRSLEAGARLYATCRADKLLSKNGRAVGVRGRFRHPLTGERGAKLTVRARRAVIVAASAIQTPLFLQKNGIGRASGLVGQRLQGHPGTAVAGIFDRPVNMGFGATQGYETTHFWSDRMKLETVSMPPELAAARLPGFGHRLMERLGDFNNTTMWGVQIRARAHGSVRRGFGGTADIRFCNTSEDVATLKQGVLRLAEMQFAAGAREVSPGVHGLPETVKTMDEMARIRDLPDDPRLFHTIVAHLFGTAVMGLGPRSSVVAPTLEAHDVQGLYVLDSSVFPTNMGVNPQHTICAMAWLASERIAERRQAVA